MIERFFVCFHRLTWSRENKNTLSRRAMMMTASFAPVGRSASLESTGVTSADCCSSSSTIVAVASSLVAASSFSADDSTVANEVAAVDSDVGVAFSLTSAFFGGVDRDISTMFCTQSFVSCLDPQIDLQRGGLRSLSHMKRQHPCQHLPQTVV